MFVFIVVFLDSQSKRHTIETGLLVVFEWHHCKLSRAARRLYFHIVQSMYVCVQKMFLFWSVASFFFFWFCLSIVQVCEVNLDSCETKTLDALDSVVGQTSVQGYFWFVRWIKKKRSNVCCFRSVDQIGSVCFWSTWLRTCSRSILTGGSARIYHNNTRKFKKRYFLFFFSSDGWYWRFVPMFSCFLVRLSVEHTNAIGHAVGNDVCEVWLFFFDFLVAMIHFFPSFFVVEFCFSRWNSCLYYMIKAQCLWMMKLFESEDRGIELYFAYVLVRNDWLWMVKNKEERKKKG